MRHAKRMTAAKAEGLERRVLLANLAVANAYLTDVDFNRLDGPPAVGEEYGIRVDFSTTDVPASTQFRVLYGVNGVNLTSDPVARDLTWHGRFGYVAGTGQTTVRVKLDSTSLVGETDETDNETTFSFAPADPAPPFKLVNPVAGAFQQDWTVTAYADLDPRAGTARDHRGRGYTVDGLRAAFFTVGDYGTMDRGVAALAAAPGTVLEVRDGQPDHRFVPKPASALDNYVLIDHGGGWQTRYGRLRDGSVVVTPGQAVTAGQTIGLVGGSGGPVGYQQHAAYLRLEVLHNGSRVETFLAPEAYWDSPAPFIGDSPGADYVTTTDRLPVNNAAGGFEVDEHVYGRHVFHPGETVFAVTAWHGLNREAVRRTVVYRPDGTQFILAQTTGEADRAGGWRAPSFRLGEADPEGTWEATFEVDGVELGRSSFVVGDRSLGLPEIKVYQGTTYVLDGRVSPLDFGRARQNSPAPRRTFSVHNHGTAPLTLGQVTVPEGFSVVGTPPASVPAQGLGTVTIQLDSAAAGSKGGWVTIHNNDAEQGEFTFRVTGTVDPAPAAVAGRHVFYKGVPAAPGGSDGVEDDAVVAPDKRALLPGQPGSFDNVTSYNRGINGVMIDVRDLPASAQLAGSDFTFEVSAGASPGDWNVAPAPVSVGVRRGAGTGGSDRVTLTWPDNSIRNAWLRVTVKSTAATGLSSPDVFSFGNLVGDTGDAEAVPFAVNALDLAAVKRALGRPSDLAGRFDFNRDGTVNALDVAALKQNLSRTLAAPAGAATAVAATAVTTPSASAAPRPVVRVWDDSQPDVLGRTGVA